MNQNNSETEANNSSSLVEPSNNHIESNPEANQVESKPEANQDELNSEANPVESKPEVSQVETKLVESKPEANHIESNPEANQVESKPEPSPAVPARVLTNEELLEKYGLSPLQLQETGGKSIIPHVPDILKLIDDDITFTLPNRVLIAKKLLSWYTIDTPPSSATSSPAAPGKSHKSGKEASKPTYKQLIFQQYYPKMFEIIKFLFVTADDRPRDHLSTPEEELGEQLTSQNPAHYLAMLVELFCEDFPAYKESCQKELMDLLLFVLSKHLALQERHPVPSSAALTPLAHDTSAMTRADILRALVKCLPDVGQSPPLLSPLNPNPS